GGEVARRGPQERVRPDARETLARAERDDARDPARVHEVKGQAGRRDRPDEVQRIEVERVVVQGEEDGPGQARLDQVDADVEEELVPRLARMDAADDRGGETGDEGARGA